MGRRAPGGGHSRYSREKHAFFSKCCRAWIARAARELTPTGPPFVAYDFNGGEASYAEGRSTATLLRDFLVHGVAKTFPYDLTIVEKHYARAARLREHLRAPGGLLAHQRIAIIAEDNKRTLGRLVTRVRSFGLPDRVWGLAISDACGSSPNEGALDLAAAAATFASARRFMLLFAFGWADAARVRRYVENGCRGPIAMAPVRHARDHLVLRPYWLLLLNGPWLYLCGTTEYLAPTALYPGGPELVAAASPAGQAILAYCDRETRTRPSGPGVVLRRRPVRKVPKGESGDGVGRD
jgi:hypothetical protein